MTPLSRLHLAARPRHWVLTQHELLDLGLSKDAIRWAETSGRIFRRHLGVYAVGRKQLTERGEWLAAVLAAGVGGVLSHRSAARLWGIWTDPVLDTDVTIPTGSRRGEFDGVRLHRCPTLGDHDCTVHSGIPVTTLRRTLIDLAGAVTQRELRSALRRAEQDHSLSLRSFYDSIRTPRTAPNYARLRRVLEVWVPKTDLTESDLELEFLAFCQKHRIPIPEPQVRFGRYRADFTWDDIRLVVETDSWRYHRGAIAGQNDATKERFIRARGYVVERFTWAEIVNRPAATARELRAIVKRRKAEVMAT